MKKPMKRREKPNNTDLENLAKMYDSRTLNFLCRSCKEKLDRAYGSHIIHELGNHNQIFLYMERKLKTEELQSETLGELKQEDPKRYEACLRLLYFVRHTLSERI